ncbi:MAG TPA: valine--tRNA ligase [Candidatus Saccharimonadales bacterium]|jgi:valyl-tRNA synthetase|nr:valine--tRNA ligase [Candidatus Saccharimonadales bacterium]
MKLPKLYEPALYEADMYALWEKSQAFLPSKTGKSYSVVVPPPNANGNLHLGHAITLGLQDISVRYHRLRGERALLLPGADHAGFETQAVFEKHLAKEGKSRFDFSREELYQDIWDFVAQNRHNYQAQFRRLGAGVDWTRHTFTLDEKIVRQAYGTFKKMWDESLIYRGERLVNYCTFHRTGFADIEVDYKEAKTPLYYMKYGPFELATTRPETKFGDTAVAVHPDDKRYAKYVGTVITVEGVNGPFDVQVIADEMVDPNFGTGVVKITPAHSFDDWEVAQRHNLPAKRVIEHDGTMNHLAGRFAGMTVMEARKAVVAALEEKGLLVRVDKDYINRVGHCYKCDTIIEPMMMEQWFVDMQPLAKPAIAVLKAGKIDFHPETKKRQLINYLESLRDWNISRQIAWGIPIPAFQNVDDTDDWVYDERVTEEIIEIDGKTYRRDPDVFDTWFSSSSWPYATLNYGDKNSSDFDDFYPLSLMETGFDILYPWVSRMLMLGLYVTGEVPFKTVYLHGLILDEHGQKMSKSKGNVVNPIDIADEYGADALRMGLITGMSAGNNQPFGIPKVIGARNFCNKLWNIARYVEDKVGDRKSISEPAPVTDADHWILSRLHQTTDDMANYLDTYRFAEAYEALYHFVWDDFADWYIEASKAEENLSLLAYALETILQIAHPFAPFLTETIWQTLAWAPDTLLATSKWPAVLPADKKHARSFEEIKIVVTEARAIMRAVGVTKTTMLYAKAPVIQANHALIARLGRLESVQESPAPAGVRLTGTKYEVRLSISDEDAAAYTDKLAGKRTEEEKTITQLEGRLKNKNYVANAPEAVVSQTRDQLEESKGRLESIKQEMLRFGS